jgi:hypothetical protein
VKRTLVHALSSCVATNQRRRAARFLEGLSADELQYIAGFLGACIMEPSPPAGRNRAELATRIASFELCCHPRASPGESFTDREHKMILLLEYLCRSGMGEVSLRVRQAVLHD